MYGLYSRAAYDGARTVYIWVFFVTEEILRRHDSRRGSLAKPLYFCRRYHLTHTSLLWFLCESMNFHPDKQLFPSCWRRGSNRWPLDYKARALPIHHGGPTLKICYCLCKVDGVTWISSSNYLDHSFALLVSICKLNGVYLIF
jgi:hypothetical protein